MTDVDRIAEAVYAAVAGVVLRGGAVGPQEVVAALDRAQDSLARVRAYWAAQARAHAGETDLRTLRTEPLQVALSDVEREQVDGRYAYKVHAKSTAAEAFVRNGWQEVKRRYSVRYFVRPDGSEPPVGLVPVIELLVPTRDAVAGLATRLHAARARAGSEADGLHVSYQPSHAFRQKNRANKEYTRRRPARFMIYKRCWLATATWSRGDDRPPEWCLTGEGDGFGPPLPEPDRRLVVEREPAAQ